MKLLAILVLFQADPDAKALGISFVTLCPDICETDMAREAVYSDGSKFLFWDKLKEKVLKVVGEVGTLRYKDQRSSLSVNHRHQRSSILRKNVV